MKKRFLLILLILVAGLFMGAKKGKYLVGVTLLTRDVFYQELEVGLREAARQKGLELRVQSAEKDLHLQTAQIENFITQRVDALVVCPVDSAGVGAAIEKAKRAGIPVFTADIRAKEAGVVSHIASNNYQGGALAGKYLAELLDGQGEVVIIDHPEVTSVQERVRGFKDTIKKYPGIRIIDEPSAGGDRDKAMVVMQNMLLAHPALRGVFAINDNTALGALAALEAAARDGVFIVGYDATPEARQAIRKGGALKADVIQYPLSIGRATIETVARFLSGEDVPREIPIDTGIVDKGALEAAHGPGR